MSTLYAADLSDGRGRFALRALTLPTDLELVWSWWMADHVRGKWSTAIRLGPAPDDGSPYRIEHLARYLERLSSVESSVQPVIGSVDGRDVCYIEAYAVGGSPMARHPDLSPHDRGLHVMVGPSEFVGRGLVTHIGVHLLAWQFGTHPSAQRVVVEPDAKNEMAIRAIHNAAERYGLKQRGNVQLAHKLATLLLVERASFHAVLATQRQGSARIGA